MTSPQQLRTAKRTSRDGPFNESDLGAPQHRRAVPPAAVPAAAAPAAYVPPPAAAAYVPAVVYDVPPSVAALQADNAALRSHVDALADQVRRLSDELSSCQHQHGASGRDVPESAASGPWLTSSGGVALMSPLLAAYDERIAAALRLADTYRDEFCRLEVDAKRLIGDNEQLHARLQRGLEQRLRAAADGSNGDGMATGGSSDERVREAEQLLGLYRDENNTLIDSNATLESELKRLRQEQLQHLQAGRELDEVRRRHQAADAELDTARQQLRAVASKLAEERDEGERRRQRDDEQHAQQLDELRQTLARQHEHQLHTLMRDKDSVVASLRLELQQTAAHLSNQRDLAVREAEQRGSEQVAAVEAELGERLSQALMHKQQLLDTLHQLETAVDHAQQRESDGGKQLATARAAMQASADDLRTAHQEREALLASLAAAEHRIDDAQQRTAKLQREADDARATARQAALEAQAVRRERHDLFQSTVDMEKRMQEAELRAADAFRAMMESAELLEQARLDRDQAVVREQQTQRDVARLQERLSALKKETEIRLEAEMQSLRTTHDKKVASLSDETLRYEVTAAESKAQCERALRDKRQAELELERLRRVISALCCL
eukprot:TRINITY_DN1329_c0_g1_i2.p1 TRINITY_DN1329_c0_g1~~TRINITY_DN1329_c0_g1_i2.p1  ORF type:complete len:613 (+),score=249.48 TRINITY_DN1329_c0_g1_i2:235-2073(+)